MSKLFFTTAIVTTLFMATGAGAGSVITHTVDLTATVPISCSFTTLMRSDLLDASGANSSAFAVEVAPEGVAQQDASVTFGQVFCNGSSTKVTLHRAGLKAAGAVAIPGQLKTQIDYTADVSWGGTDNIVALNTTATESISDVGYKNGTLVLNIHVPESIGIFKAADYHDALTLTLATTL